MFPLFNSISGIERDWTPVIGTLFGVSGVIIST